MEMLTPSTTTPSTSFQSQLKSSPKASLPKTPNHKFRIKSAASNTSINNYRSQPSSPRSSWKLEVPVKKSPSNVGSNSTDKINENTFSLLTPTSQKKPLETAVSLPLVAEDTHIQGRKETAKVFTQIIADEKNKLVSEIRKEHLTYHKHVIIGPNDSKKDLDIGFSTSKQRDQYIQRNKSGILYSHELWGREQLEKVLDYTGMNKIFKSIDAARFKTYEERSKKFSAFFQKKYGKKMNEEDRFLQMLNEKGSVPIFSLPGLDEKEEKTDAQEDIPPKKTAMTHRRIFSNPSITITAPPNEEEIRPQRPDSPQLQESMKKSHSKNFRSAIKPTAGNRNLQLRTKSDFFAKRIDSVTPSATFPLEPLESKKRNMQSNASIQKLVNECNNYMSTNENFYKSFHNKKSEVFSGIRSLRTDQQRREEREQKELIEGIKSSFDVRKKHAFKKTADTNFMNKFDDSLDE